MHIHKMWLYGEKIFETHFKSLTLRPCQAQNFRNVAFSHKIDYVAQVQGIPNHKAL